MIKTIKNDAAKKYWSVKPLWNTGAAYMMALSIRGPGKTTSALSEIVIPLYWEARKKGDLKQTAYLTRYDKDISSATMSTLCDTIKCNGDGANMIPSLTDGQYDDVIYKNGSFFLAKSDENGLQKIEQKPFMITLSINTAGRAKRGSYPFCDLIWFDEFIDLNRRYLPGEFALFQNVVSTVARKRGIRILMFANVIDPDCPYFDWMGLYHVREQKVGTIECYKIGKTDHCNAVEIIKTKKDGRLQSESRQSNDYLFAFEDPRLKVMTDDGWAVGQYPTLTKDYKMRDVAGRFFVRYKERLIEGDIVSTESDQYIYFHTSIDPLWGIDEDYDLIYSLEYSTKPNHRRRLDLSFSHAEDIIRLLMMSEKVFYCDNYVGNAIENFMRDAKASA